MFKICSRNPKRKHIKFEVLLLAKQVYYGLELRISGVSQVGGVEYMGGAPKKDVPKVYPQKNYRPSFGHPVLLRV